MAYNPYLTNPYLQPSYLQPYQPTIQPPVQQASQPIPQVQQVQQPAMQTPIQTGQSNLIWVENEASARSYPVAPGNTLILMDNDNPTVYKKQADMSGRQMPLEIYDLVKREPQKASEQTGIPAPSEQYLTLKEFQNYKEELEKRISELASVQYEDDEYEEEDDGSDEAEQPKKPVVRKVKKVR